MSTAAEARAKRDNLLAESDTYALADRITKAWTDYRKALRDIPTQQGFPENISWPPEPT
jgi:hypothetical protein